MKEKTKKIIEIDKTEIDIKNERALISDYMTVISPYYTRLKKGPAPIIYKKKENK